MDTLFATVQDADLKSTCNITCSLFQLTADLCSRHFKNCKKEWIDPFILHHPA